MTGLESGLYTKGKRHWDLGRGHGSVEGQERQGEQEKAIEFEGGDFVAKTGGEWEDTG